MIRILEFSVDPQEKYITLKAEIPHGDDPLAEYCENLSFNIILIFTDEQYSDDLPLTPSDSFIFPLKEERELSIYEKVDITDKLIDIKLEIDSLKGKLFFTYLSVNGTYSDDTPCDMKKKDIVSVTFNKLPVYLQSIGFMRDLNGCDVNKDFVNYILRLKALEYSIDTCNYSSAISYWKNLFSKTTSNKPIKSCGCHG